MTTAFTPGLVVEPGVIIPMRDAGRHRADVYRPDVSAPLPVLLMRLPYGRAIASTVSYAHPTWYARHGYVVVVQDTGGRGESNGNFYPLRWEGVDGYDSVEWAAQQPWSNGRVGMYGFSYQGAAQLLAAAQRPPHLVAIAPAMHGGDAYHGWFSQGGAFKLEFPVNWAVQLSRDTARRSGQADREAALVQAWPAAPGYHHLPLGAHPLLPPDLAPYYHDWLQHEADDDYWAKLTPWTRAPSLIEIPALHVAGWYDYFLTGTLAGFEALRAGAGTPEAQANQRLVVGPWVHLPWTRLVGERDFGPAADSPIDALTVRWFDHWLKGLDSGLLAEPPVRLFVMGEDRWRDFDAWPPAGVEPTPFYLRGAGRANSLSGDGALSPTPPEAEPPDVYVYDPRLPTPSPLPGPTDQRPAENRLDTLVYTSEPLAAPLTLIGPIEAVLWAVTSAPDTDFVVKLVDVQPDGRALHLTTGIVRARYRESTAVPAWLTPDRVYRYRIPLRATAVRLEPGHRLRVEVASSCYPEFTRHPNTTQPVATAGAADFHLATQTILHDAAHPSHVRLPLWPSGAAGSG